MSRFIIMVAALCLATTVHSQAEFSEDLFPRVVSLEKDVHFFDVEGDSTVIPAGTYLVTASDDEIQLFNLRTAENFDIHAVAGTHEEEVTEPTAMSVTGTEEMPDAHEIVLMHADGTEVSAVGSYSGIQPRGLLGEARKKAEEARRRAQAAAMRAKREAQRRAAEARRRAEQLAAEARRRVQEGVQAARAKARREAAELLREIARAQAQGNNSEVARLSALYAPRLAVLGPASTTVQQKARIIAEAKMRLQQQRAFIDEVLRRVARNPAKFVRSGQQIGESQMKEIGQIIWGEGDNQLQHPFAVTSRDAGPNDVTTRSASGFSFTIGASYDVGFVVGFGAGVAYTWMVPPFSLFFENCHYADAHTSIGADVSGGGNVDVGFWARMPGDLGGLGYSIEIGIGAGIDASVVLGFDILEDGSTDFAGFTISPGGGAGIDISQGIGYAHNVGCRNSAIT